MNKLPIDECRDLFSFCVENKQGAFELEYDQLANIYHTTFYYVYPACRPGAWSLTPKLSTRLWVHLFNVGGPLWTSEAYIAWFGNYFKED